MAESLHRPITNMPQRDQLKLLVLVIITLIALWICFLLLKPFMPALVWGLALAVVSWPLHQALMRRWKKRPTLVAALSVGIVALVLVIPLTLLTQQLISEASQAVQFIRAPETREKARQFLNSKPQLRPVLERLQNREDFTDQAQQLAQRAGSIVPTIFSGSAAGLMQLAVALFTLFFLFRDHDYFLERARCLIPLTQSETNQVFSLIRDTIDASIRGRILIAVIQGALGGIMFWILGVPGVLLWSAVMSIFAMIPTLGAFVVWIPAAAFLLLSGHPGKALILTLWGGVVISTVDNLLYPILVGKKLRLHTLTVFFSVLGGVAVFGVSGLVLGPVIVGLTDALIEIWSRRTSRRESTEAHPIAA
jgi:predicted PurR-regulated permease PerM